MNKNGTLMKLNAISISINLTGSNIRNNKKEKAIWNGNNNSQNSTGVAVERMYQNYHPTSNFLFID